MTNDNFGRAILALARIAPDDCTLTHEQFADLNRLLEDMDGPELFAILGPPSATQAPCWTALDALEQAGAEIADDEPLIAVANWEWKEHAGRALLPEPLASQFAQRMQFYATLCAISPASEKQTT